MGKIIGMLVLGFNRVGGWVQITNGGRLYTRAVKEINGESFFKFKNKWHKVSEYLADGATELIKEGGKLYSRPIKKQ